MSMLIEVEARTIYTVKLADEDVNLVKAYIKEHEDNLPSFDMKKNIAWATEELYNEGKILFYDEGKATESEFFTEEVRWSEFEGKEAEEILGIE